VLKRPQSDIYNWIHTRDLARLLQIIHSSPADGETHLYNITGPSISLVELVQVFQRLQPEVDFERLLECSPNPPPRHGAIDSSKAARELGFITTVPLKEGLLDYLIETPLPVYPMGFRSGLYQAKGERGWGEGMNQLSAVLVGLGTRGRHWARVIADSPGAKPIAGVDPNQESVSVLREKLPQIEFPVLSFTDALALQPDLVVLSTPPSVHLEQITACAERKIPVLCEKPLALDAATARACVICPPT
jgi:hypothetical protein